MIARKTSKMLETSSSNAMTLHYSTKPRRRASMLLSLNLASARFLYDVLVAWLCLALALGFHIIFIVGSGTQNERAAAYEGTGLLILICCTVLRCHNWFAKAAPPAKVTALMGYIAGVSLVAWASGIPSDVVVLWAALTTAGLVPPTFFSTFHSAGTANLPNWP